jgi:hypothetical protein
MKVKLDPKVKQQLVSWFKKEIETAHRLGITAEAEELQRLLSGIGRDEFDCARVGQVMLDASARSTNPVELYELISQVLIAGRAAAGC